MRVIVHPKFDAYYGSFYLEGIAEVFGADAIEFDEAPFPALSQHNTLAFVAGGRKVYVDALDAATVDKAAYDWCDVYAKVNADPQDLAATMRDKLAPIGPGFGVRSWGLSRSLFYALGNGWRARRGLRDYSAWREHFANYWRQSRQRLELENYCPAPVNESYIFHLSTIWKGEPECNRYRANFIKACRSLEGLKLEGGFAPRKYKDIPGFESLTAERRYSLAEYLEKLKFSLVAFNTPAVTRCHGWKLGEYLALGKAIISTPLTRALPAPLEHGRHAHFVDGSLEEIREAVTLLSTDAKYRQRLERHARDYFTEHLAPARCIARLTGVTLA